MNLSVAKLLIFALQQTAKWGPIRPGLERRGTSILAFVITVSDASQDNGSRAATG